MHIAVGFWGRPDEPFEYAPEGNGIRIGNGGDYLISEEGTLLATFGKEGDFWSKPGPNDKDFNGKPAKYLLNPEWITRKSRTSLGKGWDKWVIQMRCASLL